MKTALLVIDMQKGFIKDNTKKLPGRILKHISKNKYEVIVFTKFANHSGTNFIKQLSWHKLKGKESQDIVSELKSLSTKQNTFVRDTYSAFKSKKLLSYLKRHKVKELVLSGLELDGCVLATAFEAFDLGFSIRILPQLTLSSSPLNRASLNIIKRNIDRMVNVRRKG